MIIHDVKVTADASLTPEEVTTFVEEEIRLWKEQNKQLSAIELSLDGDNVLVKAVEKSPVRRVRRITGYLSTLDQFNDAKRCECEGRFVHQQ